MIRLFIATIALFLLMLFMFASRKPHPCRYISEDYIVQSGVSKKPRIETLRFVLVQICEEGRSEPGNL